MVRHTAWSDAAVTQAKLLKSFVAWIDDALSASGISPDYNFGMQQDDDEPEDADEDETEDEDEDEDAMEDEDEDDGIDDVDDYNSLFGETEDGRV